MNDSNRYFDHIKHVVLIFALVYFGVAWSVATILVTVLQKVPHQIKIGYYVVSAPIFSNNTVPITGNKQQDNILEHSL